MTTDAFKRLIQIYDRIDERFKQSEAACDTAIEAIKKIRLSIEALTVELKNENLRSYTATSE
jgi:hypothetical protein